MPLVVDQLQLWVLGFKWAGVDPSRPWVRIPAPVRDNFSTLLEAILVGQLECLTLAQEKYTGDDSEIAKHHLRYWIADINGGALGQSYSRELLKHAVIERWAFQDWCQRRTIPLPEFWFPPGWTDYRWPEQDLEPIPSDPVQVDAPDGCGDQTASDKQLRPAQMAKIVCKQIATVIWKKSPDMTITDMSRDQRIQELGGGQYYSEEVVRRWVKEVAPPEVSAKVGRPKAKNPTEGE